MNIAVVFDIAGLFSTCPAHLNYILLNLLFFFACILQCNSFCDLGFLCDVLLDWWRFDACKGICFTLSICSSHFPLFMLPNNITQELLLTEERILLPNPPIEPGLPTISIRNGNFSWESKQEKPTLFDVNLDTPICSLLAIEGGIGERKASLISAMLGELPSTSTHTNVVVSGLVTYVPQVSWNFNVTVHDNVLFGSVFEPARYDRTIM